MKKVPLFEAKSIGKDVIIGDTVECADSLISATGEVMDIHNGNILLMAKGENKGAGDEFMLSEKGVMKEFPEFDITSFDTKIPYYMFGLDHVAHIIKKA